MRSFSYYPGCCLKGTGWEYDRSLRAVCAALGIGLVELPDWNCCGPLLSSDGTAGPAVALPARNLALAARTGAALMVPCAGCYKRLREAERALRNDGVRRAVEKLLRLPCDPLVEVRSAVEVLWSLGPQEIARRVRQPLHGLRVACYYGCRMMRPPELVAFAGGKHQVALDELMVAVGAEPITWPYKAECCGAALASTRPGLAQALVDRLLAAAQKAGAEALVTACSLCHGNLEWRRGRAYRGKLPVFYFTELLGFALGLDGTRQWLRRHLVDPLPVLHRFHLTG